MAGPAQPSPVAAHFLQRDSRIPVWARIRPQSSSFIARDALIPRPCSACLSQGASVESRLHLLHQSAVAQAKHICTGLAAIDYPQAAQTGRLILQV